jgi:hypothetical protein
MPRGGLLAIAAGGAGAVVVGIVAVVLVARSFADAPPAAPRPAGDGVNGHASVADEGMHAAGTRELTALGCSHAMVVDMAKLLGDPTRIRPGEPRTMVTCDVPAAADAPTCERAAAVYFGAMGGTVDANVGVRVLREGSSAPACSRLYAPNGADLGVFPRLR